MAVFRQKNRLIVAALIALHLSISVPLAYFVNAWSDEASSLYTTNSGVVDAFQRAVSDERQAPLYFAILAGWRTLDPSVFFARLLSVTFSVLAIILFARLASRHFSRTVSLAVTSFFALHPFLIWTSTEIRVYSLVILLSIALVYQFEKAFHSDSAPKGWSLESSGIIFLAVAAASLYINYYLGFTLAGFFFVLIARRDPRALGRYVLLMFALAVLCLPLLSIVASQMTVNGAGFQADRPLFEGVRTLWNHSLTFMLPVEIFPDENSSVAAAVRLGVVRVLLIGVAGLAVFRWRLISRQTYLFFINLAVIGACFLASYLLVGEDYVAIRHAAVLFVPLTLFIASLLADIVGEGFGRPILRSVFAAVAVVTVLFFFTYSLSTLYPDLKKRGDWEQVAGYVGRNELPGDPILVFTSYDALAFKVYYRGSNPVLPDRNFFDFELEDKFGSPKSMTKRIDFAISQIPATSQRLWLVESDKCMATEACAPLENYVEENYTVKEEKDFYRERVRLLIRKTQ